MYVGLNAHWLCFIFSVLECGLSSHLCQSRTIKIGGVPLGSSDTFLSLWRPTFEDYLTNAVGSKQNPPVEFSLIAVSLDSAFDKIESGGLDFVYANPSLHSCLEAEFGGY
jgi:hypothetical protein